MREGEREREREGGRESYPTDVPLDAVAHDPLAADVMPALLHLAVFVRVVARVVHDAVVAAAEAGGDGVALQATDDGAAHDGRPGVSRLQHGDAAAGPGADPAIQVFAAAEAAHQQDGADRLFGALEHRQHLGSQQLQHLAHDRLEDGLDLCAGGGGNISAR